MRDDARHLFGLGKATAHPPARASEPAAAVSTEVFMLPPRSWVPNNGKLPVMIYRNVLRGEDERLIDGFEAMFTRNGWPPQWRDGIFDYHHFHSTAHEVLAVVSGSADVILGGPGGRVVHISVGDVLLLPAGTGHCLESFAGRFQVVGGYPEGQQWDIRREALAPEEYAAMTALPFPSTDPVFGEHGPLAEHWLHAA